MTYFLSQDYYSERYFESIGHARRIEFNPRGEVRWKCGCGAVGGWGTNEDKKKAAFRRHVRRASGGSDKP